LLFMHEIGQIVEMMSMEQFVQLSKPLFHKIGRCVTSNNFQVSEAAMLLWKNDRFVQFTTLRARDLFPIICPYLYRTGTVHWNTAIKNLAVSVIRICMETSPQVFDDFSKRMKGQEQQELERMLGQKAKWQGILAPAEHDDEEGEFNTASGTLESVFPEKREK